MFFFCEAHKRLGKRTNMGSEADDSKIGTEADDSKIEMPDSSTQTTPNQGSNIFYR
jgi:hypothetical protein